MNVEDDTLCDPNAKVFSSCWTFSSKMGRPWRNTALMSKYRKVQECEEITCKAISRDVFFRVGESRQCEDLSSLGPPLGPLPYGSSGVYVVHDGPL